MAKRLRKMVLITISGIIALLTIGCSTTTYVRPAPPPLKVEVRPARPHPKAVWVRGHWKWAGRRRGWVWVPGHWKIVRR